MSSLQDILAALGGFISTILIPFLFGIAFLYFLINIFRYFILEGANEQSREKAKRSAFYGIAAFVFLLILWGLIGILVRGIGIDQDQSLCSDYISFFRGDCGQSGQDFASNSFFPSGGQPINGGGFGGGGSGGFGGGVDIRGEDQITDGGGGGRTQTPQVSQLAELVFGTGKDAARFAFNNNAPQALLTTPNISSTATCETGLTTLQQASRVESTQAAYLYTPDNSTRWTNVTDAHSANSVVYDADIIGTNTSGDSRYLVHTHPKGRVDQLDLAAFEHGPTTADIQALCSDNESPTNHIIVDWDGVWLIERTSGACPLAATTTAALPIIETTIALAGLDSASRLNEVELYVADNLPPAVAKTYYTEILENESTLLTNGTVDSLTAVANERLAPSGIIVSYFGSATDACNAL